MYFTIIYIEILLVSFIAMLWDIKFKKIANNIIIIGSCVGLLTNALFNGLSGILFSIMGLIAPFLVLYLLYLLKMLGAGDIKLFCVLGSILGVKELVIIFIGSIFLNAIIGITILVKKQMLVQRSKKFFNYIKAIFYTRSFQQYTDFVTDVDGVFRFTYGIFVSCIIYYFVNNKI